LNPRKQHFTHLHLIHLLIARPADHLDRRKQIVEVLTQQPGMKMILTSPLLVEYKGGQFLLLELMRLPRPAQLAEQLQMRLVVKEE
jgi:hypothetical protein